MSFLSEGSSKKSLMERDPFELPLVEDPGRDSGGDVAPLSTARCCARSAYG